MSAQSPDPNVNAVVAKLIQRSEVGLEKYGVTTERADQTFLEWIEHAQCEAMDLSIYLERIRPDAVELARLNALLADPAAVYAAVLSGEIPLTWEHKLLIAAKAASRPH
jgi:hypothetical protein